MDCGVALLFSHPERDFPYLASVTPCIDEGLLIPFAVNGETVGTIWIVAHDQSRRFDAEDLRVLTNLAKFAAAAYQTRLSMNALMKANQELRQTASELTNANSLTKKLNQEKLHLQDELLAEGASNDKRARELDLLRATVGAFRKTGKLPCEGASLPAAIPGIGWSDHWSFWQCGYPAIMVTDTAPFRYPHYHEPTDTPEKLDYDRFALVASGMESVIAELVR